MESNWDLEQVLEKERWYIELVMVLILLDMIGMIIGAVEFSELSLKIMNFSCCLPEGLARYCLMRRIDQIKLQPPLS